MAGTTNLVVLIGRLGKDAETRQVGETTVSNFSIATERSFKKGDEWVKETDWHNVVLWRGGGVAQYLTKGTMVSVQGRLQTRSYEKDGEKRYSTEVVAETLGLLSSANGASGDPQGGGGGKGLASQPRSAGGRNQPMATGGGSWSGVADDSDLPF